MSEITAIYEAIQQFGLPTALCIAMVWMYNVTNKDIRQNIIDLETKHTETYMGLRDEIKEDFRNITDNSRESNQELADKVLEEMKRCAERMEDRNKGIEEKLNDLMRIISNITGGGK